MAESLLNKGVSWLGGQLAQSTAQPVIYSRDGSTVELNATRGTTAMRIANGTPVGLRYKAVDWIVKTQDLVLDNTQIWPEQGDQIETAEGDIFEVNVPGSNEDVYEELGSGLVRIHTKRIVSA